MRKSKHKDLPPLVPQDDDIIAAMGVAGFSANYTALKRLRAEAKSGSQISCWILAKLQEDALANLSAKHRPLSGRKVSNLERDIEIHRTVDIFLATPGTTKTQAYRKTYKSLKALLPGYNGRDAAAENLIKTVYARQTDLNGGASPLSRTVTRLLTKK